MAGALIALLEERLLLGAGAAVLQSAALVSACVGGRRSASFESLNIHAIVAVSVYQRRPTSASTDPRTMG